VVASPLPLVTLELRGQSRNSLLQLAAVPLDHHQAGVCSQQLLSDRGDLRGRDTYSGYRCKPAVFRALSTRNSRAGASLAGKPQKKAQAVLSGEGEGRTPGAQTLRGREKSRVGIGP
jgi:hypothetical protein